jgi:indole-3-glycerol phosphate synthase
MKGKKLPVKNFLEEIVRIKKSELLQKTRKTQYSGFSTGKTFRKSESRFLKVFDNEQRKVKLIAELKFASPTISILGSSEELTDRALQYESAGADAISIITEKQFFKGDLAFISTVKKLVSLPILQKDFIIDPQQIYEAKNAGADALLLIARLVDAKTLKEFVKLCFAVGIEPVVEINNEEDLKKACATKTNIIAVNARDLETFTVDVFKACTLLEKIPDRYIRLGFSGVTSYEDALVYKESGADGILVGTSLMQAKDIKGFINSLQV